MFAVLKLKEEEKTLFSRFKKSKITSERVPLPNGESFFIITAEKKRGDIPFTEILDFCGILKNKILFDKNFSFKDEWDYTPFKPVKLKKKLLFDVAVKTLEELKNEPQKINICLCDSEGLYINELPRLFPFGKKIHVVSENKSLYEKKNAEFLREYGVCVTLSEDRDFCDDSFNVVISHSSEKMPLIFEGIIFTNEKRDFFSAECYEVREVELPFEYERLRPYGIDKTDFAAALYECCKVDF